MNILSTIAVVVMMTQALLMAAEWLFAWCFAVAIWRRMSEAERKVGQVSFAQAQQWRREMLIGRLSWTFYLLSGIAPGIIVYLLRKGVRRG